MFCCRAHFSSGRRLGRTMITRKVIFYKATFGHVKDSGDFKVVLHETIRNDDF